MNSKIFLCIIFVLLFTTLFSSEDALAESLIVENQEVDFEIEGGNVISMDLDPDFIELIVGIESTEDGILQISIPRDLLDAKFGEEDDIFFVIVDGFQTEYVELTNGANARTILIPFFAGDSQIEIIGTQTLESDLGEIISEPVTEIPTWVKNNAGWWADDLIADSDFVLGIEYLITEGIMTIPATQSGTTTSEEIPTWVKNNAGWWAENQITDSDFVSGIQYLITNGIMSV